MRLGAFLASSSVLYADLLEGLGHAVGLDVRVPVLLPAVALPTHLALERL